MFYEGDEMTEEDVVEYLESLHLENITNCEKSSKYLNEVISAVKQVYDERDSLILMIDEIKQSEISNHAQVIKEELNKIQDDIKTKRQKFAKVSEA